MRKTKLKWILLLLILAFIAISVLLASFRAFYTREAMLGKTDCKAVSSFYNADNCLKSYPSVNWTLFNSTPGSNKAKGKFRPEVKKRYSGFPSAGASRCSSCSLLLVCSTTAWAGSIISARPADNSRINFFRKG